MRITVWGSRGSIASAGAETVRYGGNTACVSVESDDAICILDAGSGLRRAGLVFAGDTRPTHVLLTHLHMDHIQGLGFFRPLFEPGRTIHVWGPPSTTQDLRTRLTRYLSPPLFPVRIRDFGAHVKLHDAPLAPWLGGGGGDPPAARVRPAPAPRPDHQPALGGSIGHPAWTSGHDLAASADVLIHDGQYTAEEYAQRVGWGHSTVAHAVALADLVGAERLVLFHHEPDHSDEVVDQMLATARSDRRRGSADAAREGMMIEL